MKKKFKSLSKKILSHGEITEYSSTWKNIKEFIKIIENIIVERKSTRVQLIELKNAAGPKLITKS